MTAVSRGEITITNVNDGKTPYFHTAYTNDTNFGTHDYSGNPNLLPKLDYSKLSKTNVNIQTPHPYVKDHGTYFEVDMGDPSASGTSRNVFVPLVSRLQKGKTYTISANIMISDEMNLAKCPLYYSVYKALPQPETNRPVVLYPTNDCRGKFTRISKTFTVSSDMFDGDFAPFLQWYFPEDTVGKYYVGYDIKIEEGSTATPYQSNLLDAPWHFSTVPIGENLADPTKTFPIKTREYLVYGAKNTEPYIAGQQYTITMKATKPTTQTFNVFLNSGTIGFGSMTPVEGLTDVWQKKVTVSQDLIDAGVEDRLTIYQVPNSSVGDVQIDWLKIEKGDTRTPNIDSYKYLGSYTDFEQTDSLNPTKYSWSLIKGSDGVAGKDGVGLKLTRVSYAASTSGTIAPSTGWQTQVPTIPAGQFLWTRTTWIYSDDTSETGYSVAKMGQDGAKGDDGIAGKDGVGIEDTLIEYAVSTSGTTKPTSGWSTSIPTTPPGQYLWTRTTWTYTDNTTEQGFTVARQGEKGDKGEQGIPGENGADGRTQYTHIAYADNANGGGFSQSPTGKAYIGMYVDFEELDSSDPKKYAWSLIKGADGQQGIAGPKGEDGRTPYFHTAYTNSTDFGTYDYSGRPNLFLNLDFSKLSKDGSVIQQPHAYVKDGGSHFVLDFSDPSANGVDRNVFIPSIGRLEKGATYIATVPIMLSDDFSTDYGGVPIYPYCVSANNVATRVTSLYPDNSCRGKWGFIKKTFTVPTNLPDGEFTYFQVYSTRAQVGKLYIGYDIKIEKVTSTSDTATPYQPNLLDAPYYFSKVPLGENLADPTAVFPIKSSAYSLYQADMEEEFIVDQTYTLTMKATKPSIQTFIVYNEGGGDYRYGNLEPVEGLVDTWGLTFTPQKVGINYPKRLTVVQYPQPTAGACQIDWIKIEKGDTRTPNIDDYKYLGNYTDFEQADSPNPTKYSWSLIKGADGETSHVHTAYAWSADGTDRFTKVYPNENLFIKSRAERTGSREFVNSPDWDMAPIIDKYGVDREYSVSFDLKSKVAGGINVYSQNGSGTRYDIGSKTIQATTEYKRYSHTFKPTASNMEMKQAMLAFYGTYETGRIPSVKNVKFELGNKVTIDTPSPKEDYENAYPSYTGIYSDFNVKGSDDPKDYTWARSMGSDGESAKTLILSTSSNTVKINQDSSIQSDTITLQVNMQNMVGTATFSAVPYIGTTPQTAITLGGTGNTRTFSTSSWNKNWTSLVVTATFESFIDKQTIISVREGKDGADSITGLLTNESVTLPADKDGIVESFSEASGTFKVFDGLSDVTGRNVAYTLKSSLGGTFNINASTGAYNMTAMSKDSATATFEATYKNIKIEKILNVAKSKAGKETYTYTKYSNSKDFGNYDYSGNPNISLPLNSSSFSSGTGGTVSDEGDQIVFTLDGTKFTKYKVGTQTPLIDSKTYTISCEILLESDFVGDASNIKLQHSFLPGGQIVLQTTTIPSNTLGVWQKLQGTATINYGSGTPQQWYSVFTNAYGPTITGHIRLRNVKIEEGSTATPYQPNLLDAPYYLNKVALGENIANKNIQFPITTTDYMVYGKANTENYVLNQEYTVSIKATKPATQQFYVYVDGGINKKVTLSPVEGLTDVWEGTFTVDQTDMNNGATKYLNIFQYPTATKGTVNINWVKIEKGGARTPNIDSYKYMGIYVGGEGEQPHNPTQYAWSQIKGNDSTSYSLLLSSQVMSLPRGASKLVPENITISGMAQTGEKSIENINSRIVVEETTNGTTWTTKYDADALTYTYTPSSLNVLSARVKMYVAGAKNVQLDQKSINIVKDGSNGSNGSSSYTWIRYSENANGNPMTTTPNSKTKYIGIAITQTSTAPSAYSSYTWSRIKGSGGLVAKVYSNGGTNIEQSPIQINVETQSDGDIVEPNKVTWYMSKDSSAEWTAITAGNGITLNKKYIVVEPVVFLESNSISFKAQVEYNSMTAFDYMTVNNKSFDATKPLILRQPAAPLNPYPGLLWLDTSSGSGDPLDKTNPSLVYRWGKSAIESVNGTEYAHYAYANTPTGYQEDGVTPDPSFSVTYNSSQKPMYIGHCVTDTASDPTTPSSYNWKSITTENGSEDVNGAKGIAQEKIETTYAWGWVVLSASDLEMLPWLNNEDGSTIIDWIYQITQKTSDDSIVQTVVGSEDMSKVYAKTDAVDELSSANHELSDKIEEYNKQMQDAFAGIDTTYVNKSEFEQEMNKFNFGIDKAGGVNLIRNSTGFQWEDTAPSDEMLTNPKFEGTISTTGLDNGWVYNDTGMGQIIGAENDLPEYKIMRIGGTNSRTKYSYSKNIPVTPGQLINISGQARIPNTIGDTQHIYVSIRFYGAASNPSANSEADTIGNGQGFIYLFTDKKHNAGSIFGTDSYTVKTNNIVQDIWSNYSVNVTIPSGAAFMKICLYNSSTTVTDYFDFRKPSVVLYSGMFDFWHKNDSANAQIRQILGDESLEELGLIAGFELKGLRYKLDQDILLPNPNTEYTLSWYANKISRSGKSKYYVKVLNTKTGAEIAVSEASADTIGYQRMSVTFSVTNTSAVTIRIGLEGEGSADATLSAAGLMINIGPYPLSWQSHHEEVYSTNVRIDSSGLKVFNSDYDGYNVMTPREFAGYYRNGEVYERVFTLNKDTTKVKKLEAQERFMMKPVQIVSVDSPTIQGWAFVGYNGEDTD